MLRPAFKEDEWMLIATGAALGFCVGIAQVIAFRLLAVEPTLATSALRLIGIG